MNKSVILLALAASALPMLADASCDAVKAQIDAGLQAKNIASYTLEVVPKDQATQAGKVVGHCEGDQQIVYIRGATSSSDVTPARSDPNAMPRADKDSMGEGKTHEMQPPASSSSS